MNFVGSYNYGNSLMHRCGAIIKLPITFLILIMIVLGDNYGEYFITLCVMGVLIFLSKIKINKIIGDVRKLWIFFVFVLLINFVSLHSLEGLIHGVRVVYNVCLAIVLTNILLTTTKPFDIVKAIEFYLAPLKCIGIPTKNISMILGISIQFIPIFIYEIEMIKKAQIARGAKFDSDKLLEKAKSVMPLVIPAFVAAFRRADELAVAMESRCYCPKTSRKKIKRKLNE